MSVPSSTGSLATLAFLGGAASVASPCVLPLLPAYVAAATRRSAAGRRGRTLGLGLFIAGFTAVFVGLGSFAGAVGSLLPAPSQLRLAGLLLFAAGLSALGLLPRPGGSRLLPRMLAGDLSLLPLGAVFAVATVPCTTTLLGAGLAAAAVGATMTRGAVTLACYGAGVAVGFLACGLAVGRVGRLIGALRPHYGTIDRAGSVVTIVLGLAFALGQGWRLNVAAAHLLRLLGAG